MEDFELKLGGFKFKGVYLAVFLPIVGSIIGGVWTASEFYNRIVSLEESVADTGGLDKRIQTLESFQLLKDYLRKLGLRLECILLLWEVKPTQTYKKNI